MSSRRGEQAKRIKTEERWHGAIQAAPGPSGGAAVIAQADPDYEGHQEQGYDEDYYAAPNDEDYGQGQQDVGAVSKQGKTIKSWRKRGLLDKRISLPLKIV